MLRPGWQTEPEALAFDTGLRATSIGSESEARSCGQPTLSGAHGPPLWPVMRAGRVPDAKVGDRLASAAPASAPRRALEKAPPAGFEPAHTAPEAVALSPELRGRGPTQLVGPSTVARRHRIRPG